MAENHDRNNPKNGVPQKHPFLTTDLKFFYCCCETPEIDIIGYRERPITLFFVKHGEEYKGPRYKMAPIKRCVVCGGVERDRCPECASFQYHKEQHFNDYCHSCMSSNKSLFEKARTFDEGQMLDRQYLDREIAIEEVKYLSPTPEQLKGFLEIHPEWEDEDFNQYRASQFKAFCQGWDYVIKVKCEEEPVHA